MAFQVDRARLEEWFKKPDKQIVVDDFIVDNLPHYIQELLKASAESMRIGHDYLDIPSHKKRNVPPETFAGLINNFYLELECATRMSRRNAQHFERQGTLTTPYP